jgi:hypothetical protein
MLAVPRKDLHPTGHPIALQMKHALTAIGFLVYGNGTVTGLSVTGVHVSGNLSMDGENFAWNIPSGNVTSLDFSAAISGGSFTVNTITPQNPLAANGYLMMIPQMLTADAKVKITYNGETKEVPLLEATPQWDAGKKVLYQINLDKEGGMISPGMITVTPSEILLGNTAQNPSPNTLTVSCLKLDGSPNPNVKWTLNVPNTLPWLKISLDPNDSFASASTSLENITGTQTVYLYCTQNLTGAFRSVPFFINGDQKGVVHQALNYSNQPNFNIQPEGFLPYVGAFWRSNQTGERIIKFAAGAVTSNYGDWSAHVIWLDQRWGPNDGVVLSVDKLPGTSGADPIIYTTTPGDAENYQVEGSNLSVSGNLDGNNKDIIFRIGLKSNYQSSTAYPARYAAVLVTYANNTKYHTIYLRQGHEADYLMTSFDPVGPGSKTNSRSAVKMFSPYNVTAETVGAQVDKQDDSPSVNRGIFTDYPTQSGALFQWACLATSRERWAWNSYTEFPPSSTSWPTDAFQSSWDPLKDDHETCPSGYRRPTDGYTNQNDPGDGISIRVSELRQSLFYVIQTGHDNDANDLSNSLWGYYADGFFDRRPMSGTNIVAEGTNDNAHIGRLFYNPSTGSDRYNASIFFPYGDCRHYSNGKIFYINKEGWYWTSSSNALNMGYCLVIKPNYAYPGGLDKKAGVMIRCVKK